MIPLNFNAISADLSDSQKLEQLASLKDRREKLDAKKIDDAAEQFEAYFLNAMLKEMRKSIPKYDNYLGGSHAQEMYESMLDEKMAEELAKSKSFGLSQLVKEDLVRDQLNKPTK